MPPALDQWRPIAIANIQPQLGRFRHWCLCAGESLDWLLDRRTRSHDDTDIGVFRSDLTDCLTALGADRVFLCVSGKLVPWDGQNVEPAVHDIWVTDNTGKCWELQVMVFDDDGEEVTYRRDPRVTWLKADHSFTVRGVPVLNPMITLLFKLNKGSLKDKDCLDIKTLICALPVIRRRIQSWQA